MASGRAPDDAAAPPRRILVWGGHDFTRAGPDRAVCDYMLGLPGRPRPRICLLPTASGDPAEQIARFYSAYGDADCEPSDISLFRLGRHPVALREHLLSQDLIYVGGGSMVNLLAIWAAHYIAAILGQAWRSGVVLAGQSAGAMCWFEAGITKSSGEPRPAAGLGLLKGSLCVHYDGEPDRRPVYRAEIAGGMPAGYGLDDYAGLLWEDDEVTAVLSAREGARAWRVDGSGETALQTERLETADPSETPDDIAEFRRAARGRQRAGRP